MPNLKKIIYNTIILYFKLVISIVIGLITTRLVLYALGERDYGIYTLVAGVVGMLGVLQSAMSNASMRFMSYNLGIGNEEKISKTFNTTLYLHIIIGLLLVIFMEIGGLLVFEYLLDIPIDKIRDAKIVYNFMILTTFISIISVPYDAVINSHENLLFLSVVDIIGSIMTLFLAIFLTKSESNLLLVYGVTIFLIQLTLRIIKQIYCSNKYKECKIKLKGSFDRLLIKEISIFTWWNLFGSISSMFATSLRGIIMNLFFGLKYNAAEGIANTASSHVNLFASNLTRAVNPQLVNSEGAGNRSLMIELTEVSTKFSTFLFVMIAIPIWIELPYLFGIWLKNVPEYAVLFCRILLVAALIEKFSFEITNAIRAVGDIKVFQLSETTITFVVLVVLPYIFLKLGYPVYVIFFSVVIKSFLCFIERLYFGKKIANIDLKHFIYSSVIKLIFPIFFSFLTSFLFIHFINEGFSRLIFTFVFSIITLNLAFYFLGMTGKERTFVKCTFNKLISYLNK